MDLVEQVRSERRRQGISLRTLSKQVGIAFSTLARVERGEGEYGPETARCLRDWLGEDVSSELSAAEIAKAEELGRVMARSASAEILRITRERPMRMEWRLINEAPEGTTEILAVDARTGAMQLTQKEDLGWRRGFRHRNGFNEATHFLVGIPPVPVYETEST